jgi:carboxymethylenebutenolidase
MSTAASSLPIWVHPTGSHLSPCITASSSQAIVPCRARNPYVLAIPSGTGGMGRIGVREFYAHQFLPNPSPDFDLTSLSQTFGNDRIVEEFVICFTHSLKMDWMLPGLPATGKRAEFVLAGIIQFQDGKVAHEHLYWIRPRFCTSWESWIIQYRRPELAVLRFF